MGGGEKRERIKKGNYICQSSALFLWFFPADLSCTVLLYFSYAEAIVHVSEEPLEPWLCSDLLEHSDKKSGVGYFGCLELLLEAAFLLYHSFFKSTFLHFWTSILLSWWPCVIRPELASSSKWNCFTTSKPKSTKGFQSVKPGFIKMKHMES